MSIPLFGKARLLLKPTGGRESYFSLQNYCIGVRRFRIFFFGGGGGGARFRILGGGARGARFPAGT